MKRALQCIAVSVLVLNGGCANTALFSGAGAPRADIASSHYVVLKPKETALTTVANHDANMILAFDMPVPSAMQFFDGEGRVLKPVRAGPMAWVPGLHTGVLIRLGKATSFVALRDGADINKGPQMPPSPQLTALRQKALEHGPAHQAMMRALAAVETGQETRAADLANAARRQSDYTPSASVPAAQPNQPKTESNDAIPVSTIDKNTATGYITFAAGSLTPIKVAPVVSAIRSLAESEPGVLLISGITSANASTPMVELARARAQIVRSLLIEHGVDADKLTISAVFRSDTHARLNPRRPKQTVGLTWLAENPSRANLSANLTR